MDQVFIKSGFPDPSHHCDLLRYSISDLNNLLIQILFAYTDKNGDDNINQFLINISQQKLLDKILVTKEIWSIYYSLEEHKESSIESDILHKIFNSEYTEDMIPFYVQSRKILTQLIFGDHHIDKNTSLDDSYIDADQAANAAERIFERILPDKGLSTSTGNVIRNLDKMSYNSLMQISALDFLHFSLLEYQRLQLQTYHDEEIKHEQHIRKLKECTVPKIDDMFYKDPSLIVKNFDYENAVYLPKEHARNITEDEDATALYEKICKIGIPISKFQNNPPKTRDEQRRKRNKEKKPSRKEEDQSPIDIISGKQPKKVMRLKHEDMELNDREESKLIDKSKDLKMNSSRDKSMDFQKQSLSSAPGYDPEYSNHRSLFTRTIFEKEPESESPPVNITQTESVTKKTDNFSNFLFRPTQKPSFLRKHTLAKTALSYEERRELPQPGQRSDTVTEESY
ncbi:unnamed protein product [Moneuplotes crassus]|uniref:Uncharacterized protein n=1 Tax=Euplotes crassus TaxID=5936 RepID=A0AAD1UF04_EUPCR|nr:unnamed protein product [Moneuplotes crassus]